MANQNAVAQTESDHTLRWGEAANDSEYQKKPTLSAVRNVAVRKTNSDRTSYAQPDTTRNVVRRSAMPGTPQNEPDSFYPTTDKTFTKQYEQSYAERQQAALEQKTPAATGAAATTATRQAAVTYRQNTAVVPGRTTRRNKKKKKVKIAKKSFARARAAAINTVLWSALLPLWMMFQVPFAVLNLGFFSMALAFTALTQKVSEMAASSNTLESWTGKALEWMGDRWGDVSEVIGTIVPKGVSNVFPDHLYSITNAVLLSSGILILITIYFIYKFVGLNPILGRQGAGLKIGCLMLAFIGYAFPLLNFFPWFVPWTIAVWIYPK